MVVNKELALRVERSEAVSWASQLELVRALPGNPHGIEVRRFGRVVLLTAERVPTSVMGNRILGAGPEDEADLQAALDFMAERGLSPRVDVMPLHQNGEFLKALHERGLRCSGFQVALFGEAKADLPLPALTVERVVEPSVAARVYVEGFEVSPERVQWGTDLVRAVVGQAGWTVYLARVDGEPAGVALLHVAEGIGSLAGACTLKEFRGRGVQTALLHQRIVDAASAGCDLVVSQTGNGTVSQNNMERVGLRVAFTKAEFTR